ncbi:ThiF family adenylyltransferase [Roseiarcaceae bacterium H3SJ34-1]|uniref:HesA/MoeB/ThiF family protein n=1 Tax=Terripilifer ovatus TaxID=3032367 RepID=UPI003AB9429C|nr:ThiF family adenylyltransferase [Roseiarcaceae bacterium H3SJ34-1]
MSWLERQSFLGIDSDTRLAATTVGLVGLGGGNSHVVQQLAHLGIGSFVLLDDDIITLTNLNRLVGGTVEDVKAARPKVEIAARVIRAINPDAQIVMRCAKWQEFGELLKGCDIIVGGLDHVGSKDELEALCRRFMIPYIDMGMDVTPLPGAGQSLVSGQVVLSMPGEPCLRCLQLITEERLKAEAQRYGSAGSRPQVVWPNGLLASTAVGLVVQLLTPWMETPPRTAYFAYDANLGTIGPSDRLARRRGKPCPHYPAHAVGDPMFDVRRYLKGLEQRLIHDAPPRSSEASVLWIGQLLSWIRRLFLRT